jgi:hypothetical protein
MDAEAQEALLKILPLLAYPAACVLSLLITLWIALKVGRKVFRGTATVFAAFGENLPQRLISLGLAALFFPSVVVDSFNALIDACSSIFVTVPSAMLLEWQRQHGFQGNNLDWETIAAIQSSSIATAWQKGLTGFAAALLRVPYGELFLLIGLAALSGSLMKSGGWLRAASDNTGPRSVRVQNLAFFVTLALAVYLSIAAIAATSELRDSGPITEGITREQLEGELKKIRDESEPVFSYKIPDIAPFSNLEASLKKPNFTISESIRSGVDDFKRSGNATLEQAVSQHKALVDDLKLRRDSVLGTATAGYQYKSINRKGRREEAQYFLDIVEWYRNKVLRMEAQISSSVDKLRNFYVFWVTESNSLADQITTASGEEATLSVISRERIQLARDEPLFKLYPQGGDLLSATDDNESLPERKPLGFDLGPFRRIANWLLETESLPLALIVGMIGFGLLGSASSTLIRERARRATPAIGSVPVTTKCAGRAFWKKRSEEAAKTKERQESVESAPPRTREEPIVSDLAAVIIRGVSAAILVFLAVEGGLAIFGTSSGEPNPYVIFLTCLVASVFSETVWENASDRLKEALARRKGRNPTQ